MYCFMIIVCIDFDYDKKFDEAEKVKLKSIEKTLIED